MRVTVLLAATVSIWPVTVGFGQEVVTVRPQEIDDVLVNPGVGFMTFQRFNGDALNEGKKWTEGYPIEYQEFDGDLTNRQFPPTSLAYLRIYWKFVHPQRNQYRWELIDKALETVRSVARPFCCASHPTARAPTTMCRTGTGSLLVRNRICPLGSGVPIRKIRVT